MTATDPDGRGRVKMDVECCGTGVAFEDVSCGSMASSTWTDTTLSGVGEQLEDFLASSRSSASQAPYIRLA